jgi:uncharacterized protein (DUF924 family)
MAGHVPAISILEHNLMIAPLASPADVLSFWLHAGTDRWWAKDDAFDTVIRTRFQGTWEAARDGKLASWQATDDGALALVIVLDQFPRNMFRGDPTMFSTDAMALDIARRAIAEGRDRRADSNLRCFFYVPFEHSESMDDQALCIDLYRAADDADGLKWAELHADIIRKFGRFPHRNATLGRITTPDEKAFLDGGGFAG